MIPLLILIIAVGLCLELIETTPVTRERVYGMCTACGSVEVALNRATGTRDLSAIGEHEAYPTGHGCEVCS